MCDEKDAERYEKLAKLCLEEQELEKARKNYLEAASIYLLQAQLRKNSILMKKANNCYRKSRKAIGEDSEELTKKELARRCLNEIEEMKMCDEKSVETMVKLGKKLEKSNPKKAADEYLKAAEDLLNQSEHHPEKEDEYINLANKLYLKAKEMKGKKAEENEIISTSDNEITFKDIGGLEELKEEIKFKIIEPFKNPDLFRYYNKAVGGGILMYGPPGCGKSLIAKATAHEAEANFIHVKCSDLKSKFVGETEKNIAELFEKARENQPTIIFFDEFESLGRDRSEGHNHEKSAVAQLLTEMDGMDSKDQQILLLAATNEPWVIDPALRREGRFGKTLFIGPPDLEARKKIFKIMMKKRPIDKLDYALLADMTEGFSGADVKAVCESATDIPLRECFKTKKKRNITIQDMKSVIKDVKSVLNQWFGKAKMEVKKKNLEETFKDLAEKEVIAA
ncbi:MAG: ATP-binding protein [Candidatus Woesearchaeota archaeon]